MQTYGVPRGKERQKMPTPRESIAWRRRDSEGLGCPRRAAGAFLRSGVPAEGAACVLYYGDRVCMWPV